MTESRWEILIEEGWPTDESALYALALEVDPRARGGSGRGLLEPIR